MKTLYSGKWDGDQVWRPGGFAVSEAPTPENQGSVIRIVVADEEGRISGGLLVPSDIFHEMVSACMGQTIGLYSENRIPFIARTDQAKAVLRDNRHILEDIISKPRETKRGNIIRVALALLSCYLHDEGIFKGE